MEVTVTDTGVGISPDALETIFRPFAQTDEHRDIKQGGLGLGLSIAREIVQLHGGSLTASSGGPGTGTSFAVRLPLAAEHQPACRANWQCSWVSRCASGITQNRRHLRVV